MIGHFPDPYPGELFYSICARFGTRMALPTVTGVMRALFGHRHAVAVVDLPNHLEALVSCLPPETALTVDKIIDQHTLFPFFQPFIQVTACEQVRKFMRTNKDSKLRSRGGICTNRVRPPAYFRRCSICDEENRKKYDETYWQRLFQITGVEVCPVHEVFLVSTDVRFQPLANRHCFVSAGSARSGDTPKAMDPNNSQHRILLQLAKAAAWILEQPRLNPGFDMLRDHYLQLLRQRSLVTEGGSVRLAELQHEMREYFTQDLLALFQSPISPDGCASWIGRMLRSSPSSTAPLRHLLLMNFLAVSPEDFFHPKETAGPLPKDQKFQGNWLCLNPVCECFNQSVIHSYQIEFQRKQRRDIGIFACSNCGFEYASSLLSQPITKPDYVREFGPKWKDRLRTLWSDKSTSLRQIATCLGVDPRTVKQHAFFLELPFPRVGPRPTTAKGVYLQQSVNPQTTLESRRSSWLKLRKNNPAHGTKKLRALSPGLYSWLYVHDRTWLKQNQPSRQVKSPLARSCVDWAERDEAMVVQIANVAHRLKNRLGKPVRVTATAIGREMGKQSLLEQHPRKLPLTRAMIESVVESGEKYAIRRICRTAAKLRRLKSQFGRWQLLRAAGINKQFEVLPAVQAIIEYELVRGKYEILTENLPLVQVS